MRILLTGTSGQVGWELERTLQPLGKVIAVGRSRIDWTKPDSIRAVIREVMPQIIVNPAAYTAVDKAESEPDLAMTVNGIAPGIMAEGRVSFAWAHMLSRPGKLTMATYFSGTSRATAMPTVGDAATRLNLYGYPVRQTVLHPVPSCLENLTRMSVPTRAARRKR